MVRFVQEKELGGLPNERSPEEREFALDLSTEIRGLAIDPEFIALFLIARAELLELGECFGGEFEHFDRDGLGGPELFLDQCLGRRGRREGDRRRRCRRRGGVFEWEGCKDI